jgi:hypothetical protein
MSNFEFVFSLLVIILGLGLAEVLGGVARVVKRREKLRIGWGTGLLAAWVVMETVIFWEIVWRSRDMLPDNSAALFPGVVVTGLYYIAGALCFPDDLSERNTLDDYFMREKAKTIGAVLAAVALAFLWRRLGMGPAGWAVVPGYAWAGLAVIYVAGPVAMLSRKRKLTIAALAVLVVNDMLDPFLWMIWPG